jgi:DNA-binding NarL/FixJ family response regulator
MTYKTVIVDDHLLVRQGIRSILDQDDRFSIEGEASTGAEALRIIEKVHPDLVLLDLMLPDISGIEVCELITKKSPQTIVLILTAFIDHDRVDAVLRAGARGYLLKDAENLNLTDQLITALQGHHVFDPRAADVLTDCLRRQTPGPEVLTIREISIVRLIAEGLTNNEIGNQLNLSENTVKGHLKDILAKTRAKNRIQAVLLCKERNII